MSQPLTGVFLYDFTVILRSVGQTDGVRHQRHFIGAEIFQASACYFKTLRTA